MSTEDGRIAFLERRGGVAHARDWVRGCITIYEAALADPEHHANTREYRTRFEQSIREFKEYLSGHVLQAG